jgi:hypothetical protein
MKSRDSKPPSFFGLGPIFLTEKNTFGRPSKRRPLGPPFSFSLCRKGSLAEISPAIRTLERGAGRASKIVVGGRFSNRCDRAFKFRRTGANPLRARAADPRNQANCCKPCWNAARRALSAALFMSTATRRVRAVASASLLRGSPVQPHHNNERRLLAPMRCGYRSVSSVAPAAGVAPTCGWTSIGAGL